MNHQQRMKHKLIGIDKRFDAAYRIMRAMQSEWDELLPQYLGIAPGTIVTVIRGSWKRPPVEQEYKITNIVCNEPCANNAKNSYKPWVRAVKKLKDGSWGKREICLYSDWKLKT